MSLELKPKNLRPSGGEPNDLPRTRKEIARDLSAGILFPDEVRLAEQLLKELG